MLAFVGDYTVQKMEWISQILMDAELVNVGEYCVLIELVIVLKTVTLIIPPIGLDSHHLMPDLTQSKVEKMTGLTAVLALDLP